MRGMSIILACLPWSTCIHQGASPNAYHSPHLFPSPTLSPSLLHPLLQAPPVDVLPSLHRSLLVPPSLHPTPTHTGDKGRCAGGCGQQQHGGHCGPAARDIPGADCGALHACGGAGRLWQPEVSLLLRSTVLMCCVLVCGSVES